MEVYMNRQEEKQLWGYKRNKKWKSEGKTARFQGIRQVESLTQKFENA